MAAKATTGFYFVLNRLSDLLFVEAEGAVPVGGRVVIEFGHVVDQELFGSIVGQSGQLSDR